MCSKTIDEELILNDCGKKEQPQAKNTAEQKVWTFDVKRNPGGGPAGDAIVEMLHGKQQGRPTDDRMGEPVELPFSGFKLPLSLPGNWPRLGSCVFSGARSFRSTYTSVICPF